MKDERYRIVPIRGTEKCSVLIVDENRFIPKTFQTTQEAREMIDALVKNP